jgi:hypothetical protein
MTNMEQPNLFLEIKYPAQKLIQMLVLQNERYEEQIKLGIEDALAKIDLRKMASEVLESSLRTAMSNSLNSWELKSQLEKKLYTYVIGLMDKLVEDKSVQLEEVIKQILK